VVQAREFRTDGWAIDFAIDIDPEAFDFEDLLDFKTPLPELVTQEELEGWR
jgi:hypothetical protein